MKLFKSLLIVLITLTLTLTNINLPIHQVEAATYFNTDVNKASSGNSFVYVEGEFLTESKDKILKRVNDIRYEACKEGIYLSDIGRKLKLSDYKPLKWSTQLESYSKIRAAEITLNWDHIRPNGNLCFVHNYGFSYNRAAENLAIGNGLMGSIEQYYSEKYDLLNNTGKQTGHYTSMINPNFTHVGVATFKSYNSKTSNSFSAMELAQANNISETKDTFTGKAIQKLEVANSRIKSLQINTSKTTLEKGQTVTLSLSGIVNNGLYDTGFTANEGVTYKSSNTNIISVNNNRIEAKAAGQATITGSFAGKTTTLKFTVKDKDIAVSSVKLNKTSANLNVGNTLSLSATISPNNATNKTVTYSSSNTSVATVDKNGKVTAKKAGSVTITVKTNNNKTATCKITVNNPTINVTSVSLNRSSASLYVGDSLQLIATILPSNATNKTVTYSSNNTSVATVDKNGKVVAKKAGIASITVKTNNNKTAACKVTVNNKIIYPTSISLNYSSINLKVGSSKSLIATVYPNNATNKTVTYSSSNPTVASVNSSGLVYGKKAGSAIITVKTSNGKSTTCRVVVEEEKKVEVTSIKFNYPKLVLSYRNNSSYNTFSSLKATVYPSNAYDKKLSYSSDKPSVVSVDQNGKLTLKSAGIANITAKASNGKSASITVYVNGTNNLVYGIKITKGTTRLEVGSTFRFEAKFYPDTMNQKFTWKSSNPSVASIDNYGNVRALKEGKTTITPCHVSTNTNNVSYELVVTKKSVSVTSIKLDNSQINIGINETIKLNTTIYPSNATNKTIIYSSSNPSIVTVDSTGRLTGKKIGSSIITAKSSNGLTTTCKVTVTSKNDYISIRLSTDNVQSGHTIYAHVDSNENINRKDLVFTSSNPSVAEIGPNGNIFCVRAGSSIITAKASNGKTSSQLLTVYGSYVGITKLNLSTHYIYIKEGNSYQLSTTVYPSDATNKKHYYSSNNSNIASVDNNGKIKALNKGTTTVEVHDSYSRHPDYCTVVVY